MELKTGRPLRLSTAVRLAPPARLPKTQIVAGHRARPRFQLDGVGPDVSRAVSRPVDRGRGHSILEGFNPEPALDR